MPGAHHTAASGAFKLDGVGRLQQFVSTARGHLARWVGDFTAFWNRQPIDRFWPPHP